MQHTFYWLVNKGTNKQKTINEAIKFNLVRV